MEGIKETEDWESIFWGYNLPLQMWPDGVDENGSPHWAAFVYMPRKETAKTIEHRVTLEELPTFCQNTALVLRNLANLFEALGEGKIKHIYYPDETVEEAIKEREKQDLEDREDAAETTE